MQRANKVSNIKQVPSPNIVVINLTLTVLVTTIDALQHFETG